MHVWGVTIQGLLSNYIYDGSPRNVPFEQYVEQKNKENLKEKSLITTCTVRHYS
jgi:hypothetical protein